MDPDQPGQQLEPRSEIRHLANGVTEVVAAIQGPWRQDNEEDRRSGFW